MGYYSYSKLNTFKQCPQKYKFQYIDRIKVDVPTTVELFLGNLVHEALLHLYKSYRKKPIDKESLLLYFLQKWHEEFTTDILIVKNDAEYYKDIGVSILEQFWLTHDPATEVIVDLETNNALEIGPHKYAVRIDKLTKKNDTYYVVDYKTNGRFAQPDALQLAMYGIWVKKQFNAKKVALVWDFVRVGKQHVVELSDEQQIIAGVIQQIETIESEKQFLPQKSRLCDWCVYKQICPAWNKEIKRQATLDDFTHTFK